MHVPTPIDLHTLVTCVYKGVITPCTRAGKVIVLGTYSKIWMQLTRSPLELTLANESSEALFYTALSTTHSIKAHSEL